MSVEDIEDFILIKQIENELDLLFKIECPEPDQPIMTDKDEILNEFKKYIDFWNSKRPVITMEMHPARNKELFYRNTYCDLKIVAVLKTLDKIKLHQEFAKNIIKLNNI